MRDNSCKSLPWELPFALLLHTTMPISRALATTIQRTGHMEPKLTEAEQLDALIERVVEAQKIYATYSQE